jgi:hypothetical protein
MFRRAKLWLDAIDAVTLNAARQNGSLIARGTHRHRGSPAVRRRPASAHPLVGRAHRLIHNARQQTPSWFP